MMWKLTICSAALMGAAMCLHGSAVAQSRSPSPPPSFTQGPYFEALESDMFGQIQRLRAELLADPSKRTENYRLASRFASCAYGLGAERAHLLLDQPLTVAKAEELTLPDFARRVMGCFATDNPMDPEFVRGALAEQAFSARASDFRQVPPGDAGAVRAFLVGVELRNGGSENPLSRAQMAAECRVGFAPAMASAVLATEAGSAEEAEKLDQLRTRTAQCDALAPEESLPDLYQRAFAAQALYHWRGFIERKSGEGSS